MDYQEWLKQATAFLKASWGLEPVFAGQMALVFIYLWAYGLEPRITSGRRSAAAQAELLRRWEAGDRKGIAFKPAANSDHVVGKAMDMWVKDQQLAAKIGTQLGVKPLIEAGNIVHFSRKA